MKKAFTMIELMVVVAIVAVLSIVLLPKATQAMAKAKQTGTDKNQQFLESMVRATLDKHYYSAPTAEEVVQRTYTQLSKNEEVANLTNPFDKTRKGIGLIEGNTFVDTNKAAYIFTDTPNTQTLPEGTAYVVVKDAQLASNPTQEEGPQELKMVKTSKGDNHTIAIGNDGNLYTWGEDNSYGQLGTGDKVPKEEPTLIELANGVKPVDISTGRSHSMAVGDDGNVYAWGSNYYYPTAQPNVFSSYLTPVKVPMPGNAKIVKIQFGYTSSCATASNGDVYTWGFGISGSLGLGIGTQDQITPALLTIPNGIKIKSIHHGVQFLMVIGMDGNLYSCGDNWQGTLGLGDNTERDKLTLVTLAPGVKPTYIVAREQVAAIGDDGNLYTWGQNNYGQLGTGDTTKRNTPTLINLPGGTKPKSIELDNNTMVTTTTGEIITLGTYVELPPPEEPEW